MEKGFKSGFIALIGRPNAGKSTLINKMIGQKIAIVSDKPQTTRNKIVGVLTEAQFQMVFLDTPGIHKPQDQLGKIMVSTALNTLHEVDIIYYLIDASVPFGGGESFLLEKLQKIETPVFLLLNKIDCLKKPELLPLINFYQHKREWAGIVPISALMGDNINSLLSATVEYLPEGPRYYPPEMITDQPEKVLVSELVREKILGATREEIPHSIAVVVDMMEQRTDELLYIGATIFVERSSQKGIIIGKNGEMLRMIGTLVRGELEGLFGSKVFLELWVKVMKNWRDSKRSIHHLGYQK